MTTKPIYEQSFDVYGLRCVPMTRLTDDGLEMMKRDIKAAFDRFRASTSWKFVYPTELPSNPEPNPINHRHPTPLDSEGAD